MANTIYETLCVSHKLCLSWWFLKKPFDYAAVALLHASGKIALRKLDLDFLHWARSYFAALLI